jgi:nucleotide-binding universal stress UspA family protein
VNARENIAGIKRILVAIDASPASLIALNAAAELALRYQAELVCIYIEDINLIRMAEIPIAMEIGHYSALLRPIDPEQIERQLRARRRWIESILTTLGKTTNLRWTFRTSRGAISDELALAALESDLMFLGKSGWSGRRQVGSTARRIVNQFPTQAMILNRRLRPGTGIMLIYDGSGASERALAAAATLADSFTPLSVLLLAADPEHALLLRADVESLATSFPRLTFHWLPYLDMQKIAHYIHGEDCEVVISPADSGFFDAQTLITMLNDFDCAFLLVR